MKLKVGDFSYDMYNFSEDGIYPSINKQGIDIHYTFLNILIIFRK
jgi:hypothetical protein